MSAITKQIAAVEFHVNARQANAALESMRQSAEDAREEMAQLQEQANKGVKTVMVGGKDMDITKRIRDLNATAKAFEQAAQSQIKGVKAWDELWQHAKMGNIEQLTGQQIKAGVNGAKRQYDRLILGDEEDRRKAAAIRDIIDQANIVLDKLKGDTDKVIQTLSDGGHVADEVLQREKKNLEDMLSLTEKFSPEWQDYNRQLQAITKGIEEQAAQEKRLRGELVDANDARREAAKLDEDVARAAKEQHAAQQQVIDDAQKQMQQYQEERRQHQETAQKITDEIAKQDRQIASQSQLVESIKRENYERTKKSNVMVQEADQADKTAAKAQRAADRSAKEVEKFSDKLQKAKDDVAKLQEQLENLGNTKAKPTIDTEKIDKLKTSLEGAKGELAALMKDEQAANEKLKQFGITAADTADDVKLQAAAERALKIEEESRANLQKELVALRRRIGSEEVDLSKESWGYTKLTGTKPEKAFYAKNKDVLNDEYWRDQAGGGSIGRRYKYLQDISEDSEAMAEFKENVGMSVKDAMKVAAQRMREIVQEAMKRGFRIDNAMDEFDESYGKGPVVKLAGYVKEFNDMVDAREKEVIEMRREKLRNIQDIVTDPGDEPDTAQERIRLAKESLKFMASPYDSNISSQVKQQREEVASLEEELKKLSESGKQFSDVGSKVDALKKKIEDLKAEYKQLSSDWIKASLDREPHKMYASYEDFAKEASKKKGYDFEVDEKQYLEKMRKRQSDMFEFMTGDEVLHSPAYSRIKDVAAGHTEEDDLFGPKEAKDILDGQKAYTDACDKVTQAISKAHASLRKAFDDNLQPEQVQNIAKQLHKLQALYSQFIDLSFSTGESFMGGGKNIVKDMFEDTGIDFDKEVSKAEAQIKRTLSTAEKQKYDYYDKNFEKERTDAKQKQDEIDKRQEQIKKDLANAERDLANAEKESSAESAKSNSEREAVVVKLTKALDKQSKAEEDLKQKEKEAADAQEMYNRASADATAKHEALDKAKAEGNKKLQEESQKLSQLQGTREASIASLNQEKEAIKQKNEAVDAQTKIINDAQQTQAKSRQLSIESIEKSIALLKQENRVIGDETNPQWVENEKTIGRLNRRLEEMNANAAELRRQAGVYNYIRENISDTKKVSDDALRSMYNELQKTNSAGRVSTQVMRENKQAMREIRAEQERRVQKVLGGDLGRQNEIQIRNAIAGARELIQAYGTTSRRAQALAAQIVNAEAHLKTVGVEGARAARREADAAQLAADKYKLMQDRMKDIGRISQSAFTETQKFWKEQLDSATKGSRVYREATRNLKALAAEQQRMATEELQRNAKQLSRKDLGRLSEQELQSAIAAGKQLAQSMKPTDQAYKDLVNNIIRAEKYVKEFGLEGQRSARRTTEQMDAMNDRMSKLYKLSDGALAETKKFWQEQMNDAERGSKAYKEYEANLNAVIARQQKIAMAGNLKSANKLMAGESSLKGMGEEEIRKAISAAREYQKTLQADSDAYTGHSRAIFNAEEYLRKYGYEADKAKMKEEQLKAAMTDRMKNVMTLSGSALAETRKFWQAQMEGAARTSSEYKEAEVNLQRIAETERNHKAASGMRVMANLDKSGDVDIRQAIKAMEELRDAQAHGSKEWNHYNNLVEQGKKHLEEWAQTDSLAKFEGQMQKLTSLSDSALAETKKFWQEMVMGTEKGSAELQEYEGHLAKVKQEESERRQLANEMSVQKLGGNLSKLSENEIRQAIEAGKQLIQTYATASPEAKSLAAQIVNAERHLKQYGVEAERAAAREADAIQKAANERAKADQLMETQLQNASNLTESALKAQERYWQRLIDDPKTAASSLSQYKDNLEKVHFAQQLLTQDKGQTALDFFRNGTGDASTEQIKEQAENLKRYRDTLPTQSDADVIMEINRYLAQTGQVAGSSAAQMMSLQDALSIGKQGLAGSFKGTTEQLRQAKQVLEASLATTKKGSDQYKEIREALAGIAVEEKRVGKVSEEVQKILDEPKGRSFNELKVAVEQGRKELNSMTRTTKEGQKAYDELAEKVKAADLEMKNLGNESKGSASPFEKAVSRLKTYVTLYMGTAVALQKLSGLMDDTMTLSDKMGEVRKTTGFSAEEVGRLSDNLAKLDTRTPIQNLMDLSAAAGQLGLNTEEDVQGFTEAANKMLVALPEMGQEGATEMMKIAISTKEVDKIRKQMENGTIEGSSATAVAMEKIASTIDRLRATTAAAAPPIADFVKRVGAVGARSGITVDQVAALGATVDSLGMGTEMAATAISRMIPAIKNHAFDIARAIGVTPKTIRDLYDGGKAMDVILMILQHIHDQNLNPDGIEKLLGTGGMGEIMKELDQQGARAGIVFAGLSQNVGELRKNLGTAKEAYADNIAIQQEYDKMNDTTAAKWERLKNQLQEFFVSDSSQKFFGGIISALRVLVNIITDDGPIGKALRFTAVYLAMLKAKWTEAIGFGIMYLGKLIFTTKASTAASAADATAKIFETTSTVALGNANATAAAKTNLFTAAWRKLNAAQKANVIAAVAMAVVWLTVEAIKYVRQLTSMTRAQKEMNKVQDQAAEKAAEESGRLENLRKIVNDNTRSVKERKAAILAIQKVVPNYIATVNGEGNAYKRNTELLTAYINKLKEKALVEGAKEEMQSLGKEIAHTTVEITKQETAIKNRQKEATNTMRTGPQTSQGAVAPGSVQAQAATSMEIQGMESKLRSLQNKKSEANDALQALQDNFGKQIAESDLANSLGKKGNGDWNDGGTGGTGGGEGTTGGGGTDKNNPWGANPDAASTDWKKYNGKELVARRKQMNEFVLALQGDTDVESVLSEDPALMAAMKKGKVKKDAESVIAWYDQQRLAIQDVLHSRALTNTGKWKDPKVAHQRAKSISAMVKNDMSYYMDELDAYYTEQKSQIEDAQNSGLITEEEGWRRILENDRVWHQRRGELGQLYAGKTKEVTRQEADNIYSIIADRTGDTTDFIKVNIGKTNDLIHQAGLKNAAIERKILGDLDKGTEQDFLKMRTAVKKQLDAIEEIVSKERPFDGIVKNLRQNVEKMGIIYTDLDKQKEKLILSGKGNGSDEMKALNEEYAKERPNRLTFLLKESENAYQKTGDSLLNDMRANGFSSWADAITQSDDADKLKEALVAQLHTVYDSVQDAIKKEASEVKKQVDIAWNDTNGPLLGGKSMKGLYEAAANALGVEQQSVSRANSLIGAGAASERVADKLAIRQLQIQLNMQEHYYALVRKIGQQRVDDLKRQEEQYRKQGDYAKAEEAALDAKHAKMSLNLTLSEEETDLAKQRAEINARVEESQNRLYTSLKEWGTLLSSSMQSLFEASNTGAADYYNNLAKMHLTGEGSAGGTYVIIDNAGTKDAQAHYENLDGEDALKRQLEIEQQNAVADAWKKVMDDINKKISDQITDWMNAALQTQSIDANTVALEANTAALYATRPKNEGTAAPTAGKWEMGKDEDGNTLSPLQPTKVQEDESDLSKWARSRRKRAGLSEDGNYDAPVWQLTPLQQEDEEQHRMRAWTGYSQYGTGDGEEQTEAGGNNLGGFSDDQVAVITSQNQQIAQSRIDASNAATEAVIAGNKAQLQSTKDTGGKMEKASKSTFSVMAQAMNMYGLAYQVMSNDNMSSTQKFLTFALQSAGQVAIAMLTTNMLQAEGQSQVELPGILGKAASQLGPVAGPIAFAAMTALLGGLMALATSKVSKSKSQIAQVTGASVSAGRLSTGMLTYAEGNVNEFTDPSTLTPGQQYNVDAADGHTYRARYMGANPKTHLTNGPEFHLVGERGREAIIDANTTRQLQMDDTGIWKSIQTLYNGGSIRSVRRGGMKAFATGNIDELAEGAVEQTADNGTAPASSDTDLLAALQASLDRNTEVMQKAVEHGIKGVFNVYGKDGLIDSYDRGKKNANRYGERY